MPHVGGEKSVCSAPLLVVSSGTWSLQFAASPDLSQLGLLRGRSALSRPLIVGSSLLSGIVLSVVGELRVVSPAPGQLVNTVLELVIW